VSNPRQPANQPYYGPMYARDFADRNLARIGSVSPITKERLMMEHGRHISGFGSVESPGYDRKYRSPLLKELQEDDDTYGSGVFDPLGSPGTANDNLGIFASHGSLPGFIAREVPFTVSRDESDITDGAEVVIVPGGGMSYVESRGKLVGPAVLGPTWRPPPLQPAGWTSHDQVYAPMWHGDPVPAPALNPNAPVKGPPTYRPASSPQPFDAAVPWAPAESGVPYSTIDSRVRRVSTVAPHPDPAPIDPVPHPVVRTAPDLPMDPGVPFVNISGFGASDGLYPQRFQFPTEDPIVAAQYPTHGGVFGAVETDDVLKYGGLGLLAGAIVGLMSRKRNR